MAADVPASDVSAASVAESYETYQQAQRAVDFLSDEGFPVQHVTIVGSGLKLVETVTGRLNWGRAAAVGVTSSPTSSCSPTRTRSWSTTATWNRPAPS